MHRAAGEAGRPRRMRPDAVLDQVGLAMNDAHAAIVDAEGLGADLRHDGLETLAERGAAGDQLHRAGAVDRDLGIVGRAAPAFLQEDGDARAYRLAGGTPALEILLQLLPA